MTEKPILMSSPMVRAILDGTKTQTRRICCEPISKIIAQPGEEKSPDWAITNCVPKTGVYLNKNGNQNWLRSPYGYPGDRLWVRETCRAEELENGEDGVRYLADEGWQTIDNNARAAMKWLRLHNYRKSRGAIVPSIHMPRWASRITLEITEVRVERLQEISRGDAMGEGCPFSNMAKGPDPRKWYADLWESINGPGSWQQNPWVWVISFRRLK